MKGMTPPPEMVTSFITVFSSSSPWMARKRSLGLILAFLESLVERIIPPSPVPLLSMYRTYLAQSPASSRTSATRYSSTPARQTAALLRGLARREGQTLSFLWILATGNWRPALAEAEVRFFREPASLAAFRPACSLAPMSCLVAFLLEGDMT